jgi:hypothetical protein
LRRNRSVHTTRTLPTIAGSNIATMTQLVGRVCVHVRTSRPNPLIHILALVLAVLWATPAAAQQSCTYDDCALRIEGRSIIAGMPGVVVARIGVFSTPDLGKLLQLGDSASTSYDVFRRQHRSNVLWSAISGGLLAAATVALRQDARPLASGLMVSGSLVSLVIANTKLSRAEAGLARTVWWYNAGLPR